MEDGGAGDRSESEDVSFTNDGADEQQTPQDQQPMEKKGASYRLTLDEVGNVSTSV